MKSKGIGGSKVDQSDIAMWWTLHINDLIDADRFDEAPSLQTTFAPSAGAQERVLAEGAFTVLEHCSAGDGTYMHNGGFFFASGAYGLALTAGVATARAMGNSARRRAAEEAAQLRWRPTLRGIMTVSQLSLYLRHEGGLARWSWNSIDSMELVGPRYLLMQGRGNQGLVSFVIDSDWSALALTLWCRYRHPHHPQFVNQVWVPQGWAERMRTAGQALPPSLSGRWSIES